MVEGEEIFCDGEIDVSVRVCVGVIHISPRGRGRLKIFGLRSVASTTALRESGHVKEKG